MVITFTLSTLSQQRPRYSLGSIEQCAWHVEEAFVVASLASIENGSVWPQVPEPFSTFAICVARRLVTAQIGEVTDVFSDVLVHTLQPVQPLCVFSESVSLQSSHKSEMHRMNNNC